LESYEKYSDKTWSLVDCISFIVMQAHGIIEVLTFDKDFLQAGFIIVSG
jgi:predicted nucleic acid-binding protein